jgi:hypothetical protein
MTPFGGEARTGHFTPERVWIEDANGGVVEERATPRASFAGHVLTTPLDKLQELYFGATHCGTTLRRRSCSPNPASRPVRWGHTRKTARRGTASSSRIPQASRPTVPSRPCISRRKDYSSVWTTPWMWSATSSPVPALTTASIMPRSVASSFRPYAGRSAALRRVQCYRVRRPYGYK